MNVDSGREVRYDGESGGAGSGAVAFFDHLCAERDVGGTAGTGKRDPKIVVNWYVHIRIFHVLSDFLNFCVSSFLTPRSLCHFRMTHELLGQLAARKETFKDNQLSVEQLGELIDLVQDKFITGKFPVNPAGILNNKCIDIITVGTSGKLLLRHMLANPSQTSTKQMAQELQFTAFASTSSPKIPMDASKLTSTSSSTHPPSSDLRSLCIDAIAALPDETVAVKGGNKNVLNKIVGRVMKDSRGRADAKAVKALLEALIASQ